MGLFDSKKFSVQGLKNALSDGAAMVSSAVQNVDVQGIVDNAKDVAASAAEKATKATKAAYEVTKDKASSAYETASEHVTSFDYSELRRKEFYQECFNHYKDLGTQKISESFRATFEVDMSTMEMVDGVRSRLPVPATTIDDIFEQCKREAMRRAISSFALAGVMRDIDNRSQAKYENLAESYKEFKDRSGHRMTADENFADLSNERDAARKEWTLLENGYNKAEPLDPYGTDIEHVIAKKEFFDDTLIRMGTTDDEFYSLINSKENLVFADDSLNGSMQENNIHDYLARRGRPTENPDVVLVDIEQKDGTVKTVAVNIKDVDEAYGRADEKRHEHRVSAAVEVGMTVVKTGAAMAAQQVVGLIVIETIDVFVDEIKRFTVEGKIVNEDGWLQNAKDSTERVRTRLSERFEERDIWTRARAIGMEAGVAGALSVIPQILISMILKMPAFVLALIREGTLSTVRCVRVLFSSDVNKYESIKIILAGTASAIVGVYAGRIIGNAIAGVPGLNRFTPQVTDVLTGLLVTAVPLTAIYTFEQNKNRFKFITSKFA